MPESVGPKSSVADESMPIQCWRKKKKKIKYSTDNVTKDPEGKNKTFTVKKQLTGVELFKRR